VLGPLLAVLSTGCGASPELRAEADARAGASSRQASVSVRFAIELAQDATGPVYVLLNRSDAQPGWVEVTLDGRRVYLLERCDIGDCAERATVCGMSLPEVRDLAALDQRSVEITWDGMTSALDVDTGCERRVPAEPGAYVARFCYSRRAEFGGSPGMPGARLLDPTCADHPFTLDDRQVVLRL
jgi:hypothetical protein